MVYRYILILERDSKARRFVERWELDGLAEISSAKEISVELGERIGSGVEEL